MLNTRTLSFISCTLVASVLLSACSEKQINQGRRISQEHKVVVEPVHLSTERTRVEAVGTSRATRSITLYPAASGEVVAVNFAPGQHVEKGDILLELDQRDEKLAVELAQVRLADAQRLYERYQRSAASGATLPTTLDTAATALETARIELDRAKVALQDRSVVAPFSGYVGISDIDSGDRLQTNTAITTLDDRSTLLVRFEVPELLIGKLVVGGQVSVATWNADSVSAAGEVVDIDSRIDPNTRTFVARARVENASDQLRPGMSFRVALDLEGDHYPVLPEIALQWGAEGSFIWSVEDGKASRVPVSIVQRQRGQILVRANLEPGDLVVVEGIQRMRPGAKVTFDSNIEPEPSAPTTSSTDSATPG